LAHLRAGSKDSFAPLAVWGTCAGAILLAKKIVGRENADTLGLMDITVERNAYGRQMESFETEIEFDGINVPAIFIRAPRIVKVGRGVKVLAKCGGEIVAASQGRFLATTFHPELTESLKILCQFVELSL
jgi:5'-phosphate synthase pdxT subunit